MMTGSSKDAEYRKNIENCHLFTFDLCNFLNEKYGLLNVAISL
jgi:hypothetical protein